MLLRVVAWLLCSAPPSNYGDYKVITIAAIWTNLGDIMSL